MPDNLEMQFSSLRARCASEAERAVTRFYVEQLHHQGENLEGYVKRMVLEVPDPKPR